MRADFLLVSLALLVNISLAADACGSRGRSCIEGQATCEGGECVCKAPYVKGDGAFACYRKEELSAEILNDPMLTNFNNESIQFPYPCRYLTTHVLNELQDKRSNVIGTCEFMIFSFNAKHRGKFFLHGFDIAIHIRYSNGESVKMSSRHSGIAKFGVYSFKTQGTSREFWQNGPWGADPVSYKDAANGVKVKVRNDNDNNQLVYEAKGCGLRITFVPYDIRDRRAQVSIPGMSVAVNKRHNPKWLSNDDVMALAPKKDNGALFGDLAITKLTVEQSITARAFKNDYVQNSPMNRKHRCEAAHRAFLKCNRRPELRKAMRHCNWMLKEPRFIYCIDKSSSAKNILRLFSRCVKAWCADTPCSRATDMIIRAGCDTVRDIPELPAFMRGDMCPQRQVK